MDTAAQGTTRLHRTRAHRHGLVRLSVLAVHLDKQQQSQSPTNDDDQQQNRSLETVAEAVTIAVTA